MVDTDSLARIFRGLIREGYSDNKGNPMPRIGLVMRGIGLAACMVVAGSATAYAEPAPSENLFLGRPIAGRPIVASVISGVQIYQCTKQADGTSAFTQFGVQAVLARGIRHSFVTPTTGPPQWIAPDGSRVTGAKVSSTPNGD